MSADVSAYYDCGRIIHRPQSEEKANFKHKHAKCPESELIDALSEISIGPISFRLASTTQPDYNPPHIAFASPSPICGGFMVDRAVASSSTQSSSRTAIPHEGRNVWILTAYAVSGLALLGVLVFYFSNFITQ
jgi:hypothetical protein